MKQLATWALLAIASFAGLSAAYHVHLGANPHRVVVVVDSSNAMRGALRDVDSVLDEISARRYHEFALFTDRARVHGWSERFSPGRIAPYGPRDLARLATIDAQPEFDEADEIILLTNEQPDARSVPEGPARRTGRGALPSSPPWST